MFNKKTTFISAIIFGGFLTIGFSTNYIRALSLNDIQSGWHKLKRVITKDNIFTVNNETNTLKNAVLRIKSKETNQEVCAINIKRSTFGFWAHSESQTISGIPAGEYDVYLDTKACKKTNVPAYFLSLTQNIKQKFMSYIGHTTDYEGYSNIEEPGKLGDEFIIETITIPTEGISRTYTIADRRAEDLPADYAQAKELNNTQIKGQKYFIIKCGAANSRY